MPSVPGNAATFAIGKQTAKATPQTTPAYKLKATGGGIAPVREIIQLAETDASTQAGASVVVGGRVEGSLEQYVRPSDFSFLAHATMGATATTGAADPYTHTATVATQQPYYTIFKAINTTSLVDRYSDMRCGSMTIRGGAGQALTVSTTWTGLTSLLGQTDPVLAAVTETPLVYPQVTVTKGGVAPGTVDSFEVTVSRNLSYIQGDSGLSAVDSVAGRLDVSGSLSLLFENDQDYRAFHTGTTTGTALTTTIFSQALSIAAVLSASRSVTLTMAAVEYTEYAVPINVDGSPIRVTAGFRSKPSATIADVLSIATKASNATV